MVHFRGTPEGKTQVPAGNIEVLACNVSEVAEDIKVGQFRILGVMSAERSPFIPNGPTFREQGFNEVWSVSRGIAAPAGLPNDVEAALTSKEHQAKARGVEPGAAGDQGRGNTANSSKTTNSPPRN
jgi:tripartite-type tricarboxylate transporter receptor subunit TctC